MKTSPREITKLRKPRSKTTGEPVLVRLQPDMLSALDAFRAAQSDLPNRPEAIRRLLEKSLRPKPEPRPPGPSKGAAEAKELARHQVERMSDSGATDEERQTRRRRILRGPPEFVDIRKDQPKPRKK